MLDLALIRKEPERVRDAIRSKGLGALDVVDRILATDETRRKVLTDLHESQASANRLAKEIGELFREKKQDQAQTVIAENAELKSRIKKLEDEAKELNASMNALMFEVPNIPHASVPPGTSAADNVVLQEMGVPPRFDFDPLPHWDLAAAHGLVDFERGAKVTGAGFPFYIGEGARLHRALIGFFLDQAASRGYVEIQCPAVVNENSARGTGQLPDKEDQMYVVERDELFLVPTAEVPVTNYYRDEIVDAGQLPIKFSAYTPCFRREAGSYGKEVRGLNRLHQFDKVELVQFVRPENSYDALESLREDAEHLLDLLELPYRRLLMCAGDMGFTQAKKYDLEIFSAGQDRWLEVSSISNFVDFQARRMKVRFREPGGPPVFVHTLNGSGLALPRIVAGLLENGQQADGSIRLPEALVSYTGFDRIG